MIQEFFGTNNLSQELDIRLIGSYPYNGDLNHLPQHLSKRLFRFFVVRRSVIRGFDQVLGVYVHVVERIQTETMRKLISNFSYGSRKCNEMLRDQIKSS